MCLAIQSCSTFCNPMDCSLLGSSVHRDSPCKNTGVGCHALLLGIFPTQGSKPRSPALQEDSLPSEPPGKPKNTEVGSLSLLQHGLYPARLLCPWGFSMQEYWSGLPCPPPGDLPTPGIKPASLMFPALAGGFFSTSATWEASVTGMGGTHKKCRGRGRGK